MCLPYNLKMLLSSGTEQLMNYLLRNVSYLVTLGTEKNSHYEVTNNIATVDK